MIDINSDNIYEFYKKPTKQICKEYLKSNSDVKIHALKKMFKDGYCFKNIEITIYFSICSFNLTIKRLRENSYMLIDKINIKNQLYIYYMVRDF